jgi:hypothetical protein
MANAEPRYKAKLLGILETASEKRLPAAVVFVVKLGHNCLCDSDRNPLVPVVKGAVAGQRGPRFIFFSGPR